VSTNAVLSWRAKFLDAGKRALEDKISGPDRGTGTAEERRLRVEANQLKLALGHPTPPSSRRPTARQAHLASG
jgi:hypothetical protein